MTRSFALRAQDDKKLRAQDDKKLRAQDDMQFRAKDALHVSKFSQKEVKPNDMQFRANKL